MELEKKIKDFSWFSLLGDYIKFLQSSPRTLRVMEAVADPSILTALHVYPPSCALSATDPITRV